MLKDVQCFAQGPADGQYFYREALWRRQDSPGVRPGPQESDGCETYGSWNSGRAKHPLMPLPPYTSKKHNSSAFRRFQGIAGSSCKST